MVNRARAGARVWGHPLRRVTALVLSLAMLLPVAAMAAGAQEMPVIVTQDSERPTVTLELNAVAGAAGAGADALTGELELALRVKTGTITPTVGDPVDQPFSSISLALEISPLLTPAGFDDNAVDVSATNGLAAMTGMETLKVEKKLSTAGAMIAANWNTTDPTKIDSYYLILTAEAHRPLVLDQDGGNTLLVVNFTYDLTDADLTATPLIAPASESDAVVKWLSTDALVKFAPADLLDANPAAAPRELTYQSAANAQRPYGNTLYYTDVTYTTSGEAGTFDDGSNVPMLGVQAADAANLSDETKYTVVSNAIPLSTKYTEVEANKINFALTNGVSKDPTKSSNSATILYYDYDNRLIGVQSVTPGDARAEVNDFVEGHFIYPVLRASDHAGDDDYTDSLEREYTYRGEYPYKTVTPLPNVATTTAGVYEQDTWEARLAAYKDTTAVKTETVADGDDYPLTNKLDYVFYKRVTTPAATSGGKVTQYTTQTVTAAATAADAMPETTDEEAQAKAAAVLAAKYPYVNGWAVVENVSDIEDVWTTLGCGELGGYDAATNAIDTSGEAGCLQFADFSSLSKGDVLYVKAVYEPGNKMKTAADGAEAYYSVVEAPKYVRYGSTGTNEGGVYAISYTYGRISQAGLGVFRTRRPTVRLQYAPDQDGVAGTYFALEIAVDNNDTMPLEYTPSSAIISMRYNLADKKQYSTATNKTMNNNFWNAPDRSSGGNVLSVYGNFDYTTYPSPEPHLGSQGFVFEATLNQLLQYAAIAVDSGDSEDISEFRSLLTTQTAKDLNLRVDVNADSSTLDADGRDLLRAMFLDAVKAAKAKGVALNSDGIYPLTWQQIQYHVLNGTYDVGTTTATAQATTTGLWADIPDPTTLAYGWSRVDDYAGGSDPITNHTELMTAIAAYVYGGNPNALNQLTGTFDQRQSQRGEPYTVSDFKTDLIDVVTQIKAFYDSGAATSWDDNAVKAITPAQLQYLIDAIHVSSAANTPLTVADLSFPNLASKDYWWLTSDTKAITTWAEAFSIAYRVAKEGYHSSWLGAIDATVLSDGLPILVKGLDNVTATKTVAFRADAAGTKYSDPGAFRTALTTAVGAIADAESTYASAAGAANIKALELQWRLLNSSYKSESTLLGEISTTGTPAYWWIVDLPVNDWDDLALLAWNVYRAGTRTQTDLEKYTKKSVVTRGDYSTVTHAGTGDDFWLRSAADGTPFATDAAVLAAFKTLVSAPTFTSADDITGLDWDQFQYALIDAADGTLDHTKAEITAWSDAGDSSVDYWWRAGGHQAISSGLIGSGDTATTDVSTLMIAAWNQFGYASEYDSPDSKALDDLYRTDRTDAGGSITAESFIEGQEIAAVSTYTVDPADYLYLRADDAGTVAFGSVSDFIDTLEVAIGKAPVSTEMYIKGLQWIEVQHLLISGTTYDGNISGLELSTNYWWQAGRSDTGSVFDLGTTITNINSFLSTYDQMSLEALLTLYLTDLKFSKDGTATGPFFENSDASYVAGVLINDLMFVDIWSCPSLGNLTVDYVNYEFTWNELQYYLAQHEINGGYAGVAIPLTEEDTLPDYSSYAPTSFGFLSFSPMSLLSTSPMMAPLDEEEETTTATLSSISVPTVLPHIGDNGDLLMRAVISTVYKDDMGEWAVDFKWSDTMERLELPYAIAEDETTGNVEIVVNYEDYTATVVDQYTAMQQAKIAELETLLAQYQEGESSAETSTDDSSISDSGSAETPIPADPDPVVEESTVDSADPADPDPADVTTTETDITENGESADPDAALPEETADASDAGGEEADAVTGADPVVVPTGDPPDADPPDDTGQTTDVTEPPGDTAEPETTQEEGEPQMSTTFETQQLAGTVWSKDVVRILAEWHGGTPTVVARMSFREEVAA